MKVKGLKKDIAFYYADVKPSYLLLKQHVNQISEKSIHKMIKEKVVVSNLNSHFLKDAMEFLRLSILNLMAYKFLMCGNYLAWGKVTLHFCYFYSINASLRLSGFALVHLPFTDKKYFRLCIERVGKDKYRFSKLRTRPHWALWDKFYEYNRDKLLFPIRNAMLSERYTWNYDLLFPSQSMTKYAKADAKLYCDHNFLDPNFGVYDEPEASEYYWNLMVSIGYEERIAGDLIQDCIKLLRKIAQKSKYKANYIEYFREIAESIEDFKSHPDTKKEIQKWIKETLAEIS